MKRLSLVSITVLACCATLYLFCLNWNAASRYEPKIIINSERVDKRVIYQSFIAGGVQRIQIGTYRPSSLPEIIILGQTGVHFLSTENYKPVGHHIFKDGNGKTIGFGIRPEIIDINNDDSYEIIKGGGGFGEIGLLNNKGNKLWTFQPNPKPPPTKMIYGDLDKDNKIEFYVADYNALYRLDERGNVVWKIDKESTGINLKHFIDIGIFTENGSEQQFLLVVNDYNFIIFDFNSKIIKKFKTDQKIIFFEIVRWNNKQFILSGYYNEKVILFDLNGKSIYEFKLKDFPLYHAPNAVAVKFKPDENEYLVVLAHSSSSLHLTQLNIISPEGQISYQEIIKKTYGLASLYRKEKNSEVLLIGDGPRQVLEYSMQ